MTQAHEKQAPSHKTVLGRSTATKTGLQVLERNISRVPVTEEQLRRLFNALDTNETGTVPCSKLHCVWKNMAEYGVQATEEDIKELLAQFPFQGKETVNFDEFCCFVLQISQW